MAEDRVDLLTAENSKYHENVSRYELRFPAGTRLVEDLEVDPAFQKIDKRQYIDPAILAAELRNVWKKSWQFAGTDGEVSEPGDYLTYDVGDQGYVIVRQDDGSLRAFHNACQHRGNRLVDGHGNVRDIRCPFHGWAWRRDGSLRAIPDRHTFDTLDGDLSLPQVRVDSWAGMIFINPDHASTETLADFLKPVAEQLAPYKLDQMKLVANIVMPVSANWKTCVEAFVEVYHVNGVHPQFLAAHDDMSVGFEILSEEHGHSRAIIPFGMASPRLASCSQREVVEAFVHTGGLLRGASLDLGNVAFDCEGAGEGADGAERFSNAREYLIAKTEEIIKARAVDLSDLSPDQYIDDWHYFIFPNLVLNIAAGGFLLLSMRPHATDPDQAIIHTMLLQKFSPETEMPVKHQERKAEGEHDYGLILNQDFTNVVLTQRGMHSDGYSFSRLSKQECRISMMQKVLQKMHDAGGETTGAGSPA